MTAVLIGGDKGGVGKDVVAEGVHLGALRRGHKPMLIELESACRLGRLYADAMTIPIDAPAPDVLYANPDVVYEPIDRAARLWTSCELSVTSLGANVTSALINWSRNSAATIQGGDGLVFAVVLTMGRASLASGFANLFDVGRCLPRARRVAILNDVHAAFLAGDPLIAQRLEEARGDGAPIETVHIPRLNAPAWGHAQNFGSLAEIAQLDPQKLLDLGLPEGQVRRSMPMITHWIVDELVTPLEILLPPAVKARREKAK